MSIEHHLPPIQIADWVGLGESVEVNSDDEKLVRSIVCSAFGERRLVNRGDCVMRQELPVPRWELLVYVGRIEIGRVGSGRIEAGWIGAFRWWCGFAERRGCSDIGAARGRGEKDNKKHKSGPLHTAATRSRRGVLHPMLLVRKSTGFRS
ncbi:MAG: hypothetical protein ACKVHU_04080 [Acidimicrobiales bacterium]